MCSFYYFNPLQCCSKGKSVVIIGEGGESRRGEHDHKAPVSFIFIIKRADPEGEADVAGVGGLSGSPTQDVQLMACVTQH